MNSAPSVTFGLTLRDLRERRRLSQSRLGDVAGLDRSLVSRIESGQRGVSRETVERLAEAMRLNEMQADQLRIAAGFAPANPLHGHESVIGEIAAFLSDPRIHPEIKDDVRDMLALLIRQARRAA